MSGLFLKCSDCGGLARPIPSTPGVLTCTCGRVKTPLPIPPVDLASVRQLSMNALYALARWSTPYRSTDRKVNSH